jgi:hypothetical protein
MSDAGVDCRTPRHRRRPRFASGWSRSAPGPSGTVALSSSRWPRSWCRADYSSRSWPVSPHYDHHRPGLTIRTVVAIAGCLGGDAPERRYSNLEPCPAGGHRTTAARPPRTLLDEPNDAYRSQNAGGTDGHLGMSVGSCRGPWFRRRASRHDEWRHHPARGQDATASPDDVWKAINAERAERHEFIMMLVLQKHPRAPGAEWVVCVPWSRPCG